MRSNTARWLWLIVLWVAAGCGDDTPPVDPRPDGGLGTDAAESECRRSADCDDGSFCNGSEACVEGVCASGEPPCREGEACDEGADRCGGCAVPDADGDGRASLACGGDDCDDGDADRFPGNAEVCDAADHDEDCDPRTFGARDADGDGYDDAACCNVDGEGARSCGVDCDDADRARHPDLPDRCGDGVDDDCDGATDEGGVLHLDADNDGRGDPDISMSGACTAGWVFNADDCDDTRSETYGGAVPARERCDGLDNDCSLPGDAAGGPEPAEDADGDGHSPFTASCVGRGEAGAIGFEYLKDDCDDADPTTYAGAIEVCGDGVDQDCDRVVDNPTQVICTDFDGDGHGDRTTRRTIESCVIPSGSVPDAVCDDCNDASASVHPGHREICDRLDNDCSAGGGTATDEDVDGDGYAPIASTCAGRGEADAPESAFPRTDCADDDTAVHPGAAEVCDGLDADCSTGGGAALDEDADGDLHAPLGSTCLGRGEPGAGGTAFPKDDCDDTSASVHGGRTAVEDTATCDGVDQDCDASTSELTLACTTGGYCAAGGTCARAMRVAQISAGGHTCTAMGDGTVRCWGDNRYRQLGDGTTTDRTTPVTVLGVSGVVEVAVGGAHTCARRSDGTVRCWGDNRYGQLGDGSVEAPTGATTVAGLDGVVELDAGTWHTCARRSDATVRCWGRNTYGMLGDGTTSDRPYPIAVPSVAGVRSVSAGSLSSCALLDDGTARCWGSNSLGQLGDGTSTQRSSPVAVVGLEDAVELEAGGSHACARLAGGTVQCWGSNQAGQIGVGMTSTPPTPITTVPGLDEVVALWAGNQHTCARRSDGTVRCWGDNTYGQLGDGTTTSPRSSPTLLTVVSDVVELSLGASYGCALLGDDLVRCWGYNARGQLGDGTTTHRSLAVEPPLGVVELTSGGAMSCARLEDGTARCWGRNEPYGQLGDGTTVSRTRPTTVLGLAGARAIQAGTELVCAWGELGAQCWGRNDYGQLGDGTRDARSAPTPVSGLAGAYVAPGWLHSCARMPDGTATCWGDNRYGQVGDGTTSTTPVVAPVAVTALTGVAAVGVGDNFSCALLDDGTVRCWGSNTWGQIGDGSSEVFRASPTPVSGLADVAAIAVGGVSTYALLADGTVRAWGNNQAGQLGDGTTTQRNVPVAVSGLDDVTAIASLGPTACALRSDGSVWCWGANGRGQLGDGTTTSRSAPVQVAGVSDAIAIAPGAQHTCALRADRAVLCWGEGRYGQLADGTTTISRPAPAVVLDL